MACTYLDRGASSVKVLTAADKPMELIEPMQKEAVPVVRGRYESELSINPMQSSCRCPDARPNQSERKSLVVPDVRCFRVGYGPG
jgi:hypothetical protein